MNNKYLILIVLFLLAGTMNLFAQYSNDTCSQAVFLCANNTTFSSTIGGTPDPSDPPLDCGDMVVDQSIWFTVTAISTGPLTITLSNFIGTGLAMEAYTGVCGALTAVPGACASGATTFGMTFNVTAGTTYYIMVDGEQGDQTDFNISASGSTIIALPDADFTANPNHGCLPLLVGLHNTTIINGGSGITYNWSFDNGPSIPWSTADTNISFASVGVHVVSLTVCNTECGCKTEIQDITVQEVTPSFTHTPTPACLGEPITFKGSAFLQPPYQGDSSAHVSSWKWFFDDTLSGSLDSATGQNVIHSFVGSANDTCFNVRLIIHGACGFDTVMQQLCFHPKPLVDAGPDQIICDSQVVTLTANAANVTNPITYLWTGTGGTITHPDSSTTTVSGLTDAGSPYRFIVTVTTAIGCTAKDTVYVTVHPKPRVHAITNDTVCPYTPVQLNAIVDSGVAPFTFHWTPANGLDSANVQNPIATVASTSTFCVMINDSMGCPSSDTNCVTITIFPKPTIASDPVKHCASDTSMTSTLTITGAGSGNGVTISWDSSANYTLITGSNADSSIVIITFPRIVGLYSFEAIIHDANGCWDTLMIKDSVTDGLTMQLSPSDTICQGQSTTLSASGAVTYSWYSNPIDPSLSGQNTLPNPTVSPTITTTYYVIGTNQRGCTKLDSILIVVHITPTAMSNPVDTSVCGCSTVNLNGTGSSSGMNYHWIALHGSVISNANILVTTALACVTDTFLLIVTDPTTNCKDTAREFVTVNPLPTVHIVPIAPVCGCSNINLNGNGSSSGMNYQWISAQGNNILNSDSLQASVFICSTDTFTLIITNPITLCVDSAKVVAVVDTIPTAIAASLDSVCGCTTVSLNGTGSTVENGITYLWTSAHGNIIADSTALVTTAVACVSDTFTLHVFNNTTSCRDSLMIEVTVNPKPHIVAAPLSPVCGCTNVNLIGTGSDSAGMTFLWVSREGNVITNPTSLDASAMICHTDTFTLIITNSITLCVDSAHTTVVYDTVPTVMIHDIAPVCGCTTVTLDGTGSTTGLTYLWTSLNGTIITNPNSLVTNARPCVSDVFKLLVTNQITGCKDSSTVSVTVNPIPNAVIGLMPDTICHGTETTINLNGTGSDINAGTTYDWSANPSAILIFDTASLNTTALINQTTTFTLKVTTVFGCDSTVSKTIHVFPSPTITNSHNSFCTTDSVPWNITITINGAGVGTQYNWFIIGCSNPDTASTQSATFNMSACPVGTTNFEVITVDGVTGCYDTLNTSVIISNGVHLMVSHDTTICQGDSLTLHVSGAPNYTWSNGSTNTSIVVSPPLAVGSYTFWVTGALGGCNSTDSIHVHVSTTPNTPAITGPTSICAGTNGSVYTIGNPDNGATYAWSVPSNGTIISGQGTSSITVNWTSAGNTTITVTETIGSCMGVNQTLNVTINPIPNTSPITGPISVCANATDAYSVTNHNGSTYNWIITNGTQQSGGNTNAITVQWGAAGIGTIKVVETNTGCPGDTVTLDVTIHPIPNTSPINGSTTVCENSTGEVYDVINTIGSEYHWTITGGTQVPVDSLNNITVNWGASGTGTVTVYETSSFGCSGTAETINVTIETTPTASITSPTNNTVFCDAEFIILHGVAPVGNVTWTTSGNGTFSNPNDTVTGYIPGTADVPNVTLTMTVSNSPCPNATAAVTLHINPAPSTSSITGLNSVCVGTNGVIDSVTNTAGSTYQWFISPNGTITVGNGSHSITTSWNTAGSGWIKVLETNSFGCHGDTVVLDVTVNPLPVTSAITGPDTVCENSIGVIYFVTNTTGSTYNWTSSPGSTIVSGQGTNSVTLNFTTSIDTLIVQETNINGCIGIPETLIVKISLTPLAIATGPGTICQGQAIPLTGTSGNGTIVWTTSGTGSFSNDTIASPTYTPGANETGNITLTMTVTNSPCADAIATVNVLIHPTPVVTLAASANPLCWGSVETLTATGGGTYFWSTSAATAAINVSPIVNTSYAVTVTSAFGCTASDSINIQVLQPGYDSASAVNSICKGDSIHLTGTAFGAATGGVWTTTGSGKFYPDSTTWNAVYFPSPADTSIDSVRLIFTPTGACINFGDTVTVELITPPTVYAGPNQTVIVGIPVQLAGSGNFASEFIWTTSGTGIFNPNDSTLNATYVPSQQDIQDLGDTLTLTAVGGCRVVTSTMIIDYTPSTFPNVVTPYPSSPGKNDYFAVEGLPPNSTFTVFNRWGEKIYESTDYQNDWDAHGLVDGTYYYVLVMNGKGYKGYVTILRD